MNLQEATDAIRAKVGDSSGVGATVKFNCGDDGVVFIDGNATPPAVSNDDNDADCTVSLDIDVLGDLVAGDLDPTAAFMQGKLKVEGDMGVAMKLGSIL